MRLSSPLVRYRGLSVLSVIPLIITEYALSQPIDSLSIRCPFAGAELLLQLNPLTGNDPIPPALVEATRTIMVRRIAGLGLTNVTIAPLDHQQFLIQFPSEETETIPLVQRLLGTRAQLEFRLQYQGTQSQLTQALQQRQTLFAERQQLRTIFNAPPDAIASNHAALQQNEQHIASLWCPTGYS